MIEQATIFFLTDYSASLFKIDYNVEIRVYSVEVADVKMDDVVVDDFSANVKRYGELRELEIQKAANRLITEYPEIKEKVGAGDYLHIAGHWFAWNNEWIKLSREDLPGRFDQFKIVTTEKKVEEKRKMTEARTDLTTLIYCYVKALIKRDIGDADVFRSYLVALVFDRYGEMTVEELRKITYNVAKDVAIDSRMMFGSVLDMLKENGIDLWKIADEEEQKKKKEKKGDGWVLEY